MGCGTCETKPYMWLDELVKEVSASKVVMDEDEVRRALEFLHAALSFVSRAPKMSMSKSGETMSASGIYRAPMERRSIDIWGITRRG